MKALTFGAALALLVPAAQADNSLFTAQATPDFRGEVGARTDLYDMNFTSAAGGVNLPDAGISYGGSELVQLDPGAILLGGDYIYGLGGAADYVLSLNNPLALAEVSLQLRVEGIPLDNGSVSLRWNDAFGNPLSLAPSSTVALNPNDPNEQQFLWNAAALAGLDVRDAELTFAAAGAHMGLDVVLVDFRTEHDGLVGDVAHLSESAGGQQQLELDAGADHAGGLYLVVGSLLGTSPGTPYGGLTLPLNFDLYMLQTINRANGPVYQNTLGFLDANGLGSATLNLPPSAGPGLVGLHADHAAVIFDPVTLAPLAVTGSEGVDVVL